MSGTHPIFSTTGPDATYTPATYNDVDGSYQKGVNPAVWLAGQLNALKVDLYDTTIASTGYAVGDRAALVTKYDPTTLRLVSYWQNLTQGTLPGSGPAAGSFSISPLMGLPQGEAHIGAISGGGSITKIQWNRPANTTAYVAGALLGKTTAVSAPSDGTGNALILFPARVSNAITTLSRVRFWHSNPAALAVNIHFFEEVPTPTVGDGGAFNSATGGTGGNFKVDRRHFYAGKVSVTTDCIFTDGATGIGTPQVGSSVVFAPAFGTKAIYALVEVTAAYTPANTESFGLTLEIYQD